MPKHYLSSRQFEKIFSEFCEVRERHHAIPIRPFTGTTQEFGPAKQRIGGMNQPIRILLEEASLQTRHCKIAAFEPRHACMLKRAAYGTNHRFNKAHQAVLEGQKAEGDHQAFDHSR